MVPSNGLSLYELLANAGSTVFFAGEAYDAPASAQLGAGEFTRAV